MLASVSGTGGTWKLRSRWSVRPPGCTNFLGTRARCGRSVVYEPVQWRVILFPWRVYLLRKKFGAEHVEVADTPRQTRREERIIQCNPVTPEAELCRGSNRGGDRCKETERKWIRQITRERVKSPKRMGPPECETGRYSVEGECKNDGEGWKSKAFAEAAAASPLFVIQLFLFNYSTPSNGINLGGENGGEKGAEIFKTENGRGSRSGWINQCLENALIAFRLIFLSFRPHPASPRPRDRSRGRRAQADSDLSATFA